MKLDLLTLKSFLINEIQLSFLNKFVPQQRFCCFEYEIKDFNFSNFLEFIPRNQIFYFKSKDNELEILSLGKILTLKNTNDLNELNTITDENDKLYFYGHHLFEQNQHKTQDWEDFSNQEYTLPKITFIKKDNETKVLINIPKNVFSSKLHQAKFILALNETLSWVQIRESDDIFQNSSKNSSKQKFTDDLSKIIHILEQEKVQKVVYARKVTLETSEHFNPSRFIKNNQHTTQNSYRIFLQKPNKTTFFTASPETLFKIKDNKIEIDSLAGSIQRSTDPIIDEALGVQLLKSDKDLDEHRIVTDTIIKDLISIGLKPKIVFKENLLSLSNIQHIHTKIIVDLRDSNISYLELLNTLHPTPAVAGLPRAESLSIIEELEDFERGLYAAPIGIISKNHIEFAVGIRCFLFKENSLHFYAGGGIVKNSNIEQEWNETQTKLELLTTPYIQKNINKSLSGIQEHEATKH